MDATARPRIWILLALAPALAWVLVWLIGPDESTAQVAMDMPFGRDIGIIWRALALIGPIVVLAITVLGMRQSVQEEHDTGMAEWIALGAGAVTMLALVSSSDLPERVPDAAQTVAEAPAGGEGAGDASGAAGEAGAEDTAAVGTRDLTAGTHVVLLGTGTPNPDPDASGPATAILVDGRAYLVDAGPGVVRRAAAAAERYGVPGLEAANLDIAFLTHLHSDHTVGLPDLIHTPWVHEREAPLRLFGPDGTEEMARHLTEAWSADIENRLSGRQFATPDGWRVEARDVDAGVVYEDDLVRVTAIAVPHTGWSEAFGYRFDTADRSIVISGDTTPSDAIVAACDGCDVLVHEVYSASAFEGRPEIWRSYHSQAHTSTTELGELAARAAPGILVLHHQLLWGATVESALSEIRAAGYEGALAFGRDLEVY